MLKQVLVIGATLFISFSASSHQMVCDSNGFRLNFDMHSGNGNLSSSHSCHEHSKPLHCDQHSDLSWTCHDSCHGTQIRIKRACHGDCHSWTAKMKDLHQTSFMPVYMHCHEHMDNNW